MLGKLFKVFFLSIFMILSKLIFIISVQVSEGSFHIEIKGILAFLVVDMILLKIIHSKKLMYSELFAIIFMVLCEFSGNEFAIIFSTIIFIVININILIQTWKWNPNPVLKK